MIETINIADDTWVAKDRQITSSTAPANEPVDPHEVTVRLIKILLEMPEKDQRLMLKTLAYEQAQKQDGSAKKKSPSKDLRRHPRKTSLIAVDCVTHDTCFTNFIHNISNGGVFIETNAPFYVDQKITLNFSLSEAESPILIAGEVVRVDASGIGVKFIEGDVHKLAIRR